MGLVLGGEGNDSSGQGIESTAVQGTPSSPSSTPPSWGKGFCIDEREYHKSNGSFHTQTQGQGSAQGQGQTQAQGPGQAQGHHYHPFYDTSEGDIITDLDLALAPAAVPTRATHRDKDKGQGQHKGQGQGQHRDKGSDNLAHVPVAPWPTSIEGLTVGR